MQHQSVIFMKQLEYVTKDHIAMHTIFLNGPADIYLKDQDIPYPL